MTVLLTPSVYRTSATPVPGKLPPGETPGTGYSWDDYEGVQVENDVSGEDDGGWGVVRSKGRSSERPLHSSPSHLLTHFDLSRSQFRLGIAGTAGPQLDSARVDDEKAEAERGEAGCAEAGEAGRGGGTTCGARET